MTSERQYANSSFEDEVNRLLNTQPDQESDFQDVGGVEVVKPDRLSNIFASAYHSRLEAIALGLL